jgi:hypothetical protein
VIGGALGRRSECARRIRTRHIDIARGKAHICSFALARGFLPNGLKEGNPHLSLVSYALLSYRPGPRGDCYSDDS